MFTRLRTRPRPDQTGFTTIEAVAASMLIVLVSASVATAMAIAMKTSVTADQRATSQISATKMIDGITANVTLADPILAIGRERMVLTVTTATTCERHDYLVGVNQNGTPRLIRHRVQVAPINTLTTCQDIAPSAWSTIAYSVDREEIVDLADPPVGVDMPVFRYYTVGRSKMVVKGDPNYRANYHAFKAISLPCKVGQVEITLNVREAEDTRVYKTTASPLSASMGMTAC